jgi:hypothetical protein
VTLTGLKYPPNDAVALSFKDASGTVTRYPTVASDAAGSWSAAVTVPAHAAIGNGQFIAKSTSAGISLTQTFNVTS